MATKVKALTSKLEWKMGTGGTVYVEIAQLTELHGPGLQVSKQPTTDLASTVQTEVAFLAKHGPITGKGFWDPDDTTGHVAFLADARAKTMRAVKITNSDATPSTIEFATAVNFVESLDITRNKDGFLEFSFSINCNEAPTIA